MQVIGFLGLFFFVFGLFAIAVPSVSAQTPAGKIEVFPKVERKTYQTKPVEGVATPKQAPGKAGTGKVFPKVDPQVEAFPKVEQKGPAR